MVKTDEGPMLEWSGTLIHGAEVRTRLLDGDTHSVPVVCMDIELDNSLRNIMHVEQPFPADHFPQAKAAAHRYKKDMHVTVQVHPFDMRLVARNASHIFTHPAAPAANQPLESSEPCQASLSL